MKKIIASLAAVAITAATLASCAREQGDVFVITAAHSHPEGTGLHDWMLIFQREVHANSDGRIMMNVFPNQQLGSDSELMNGVLAGNVTMMGANTAPKVFFVPDLAVFDVLFAHDSLESARRWWNDPETVQLMSSLFSQSGFHHLGGFDSEFRVLTANSPVLSLDDLTGVRIRTSTNVYHINTWQAIGANPTPLGIGELYIGLQQGVVDAQENPNDLNLAWGFFEHQQFAMEIEGFYHINNFVMDPVFYNNLPEDLQRVIDAAVVVANREAQANYDRNAQVIRQQATAQLGIEWVPVASELRDQFAERAAEVWPQVQTDVSPQTWTVFMRVLERSRQT